MDNTHLCQHFGKVGSGNLFFKIFYIMIYGDTLVSLCRDNIGYTKGGKHVL